MRTASAAGPQAPKLVRVAAELVREVAVGDERLEETLPLGDEETEEVVRVARPAV